MSSVVRRDSNRWDLVIDVSPWFDNEKLSLEQKRDAIVREIRETSWVSQNENVSWLLADLSVVVSHEDFYEVFDCLLDTADTSSEFQVLIQTRVDNGRFGNLRVVSGDR